MRQLLAKQTRQHDEASELVAMRWVKSQAAVFSFLRSQIFSYHDAEDALQRVAATAIRKYDEYDPDQPFTAWALGFARIEVMRYRSTRSRDKHVFNDELVDLIAETYSDQSDQLQGVGEALESCVKKLSGRARMTLDLYYGDAESGSDVAKRLGITENAVFVSLHRIRAALRKCIHRHTREVAR